jgi:hypothetical protein
MKVEKSSILRFVFILGFIGMIAFPLTYFTVKKMVDSSSTALDHHRHRFGFSMPIQIVDNLPSPSNHRFQNQYFSDYTDIDSSFSNHHHPPSPPSPPPQSQPFVVLTEEMRRSIKIQNYAAHTISCFDQITKKFYICDNRVENTQLSCPIIYPGYRIQIISENREIYRNITRETTSCFILWFHRKNPSLIAEKKHTADRRRDGNIPRYRSPLSETSSSSVISHQATTVSEKMGKKS